MNRIALLLLIAVTFALSGFANSDGQSNEPQPTHHLWRFWIQDRTPDNDVTFFATSDLHYGVTTTVTTADRATIDFMNVLPGTDYPANIGGRVGPPRGVIVSGDLTQSGKPEQWNAFVEDYGVRGEARVAFPVYEGYGNHDGGPNRSVAKEIRERNKLRPGVVKISENGLHYSWDWGRLHLVQLNIYPGDIRIREGKLDSPWNDPGGSLSFLKADLAENVGTGGRPVIIVFHYGFDIFSVGGGWWSDQERENFYLAVKDYNVIGIVCGHSHVGIVYKWRGLDVYGVGCGQRDPNAGECFVFHVTPTELVAVQRFSNRWGIMFRKPITGMSAPSPLPIPIETSIGYLSTTPTRWADCR